MTGRNRGNMVEALRSPLLYYSCDSLGHTEVRSYRNPEAQESKGAGIHEKRS
jgi:hypothetical protein